MRDRVSSLCSLFSLVATETMHHMRSVIDTPKERRSSMCSATTKICCPSIREVQSFHAHWAPSGTRERLVKVRCRRIYITADHWLKCMRTYPANILWFVAGGEYEWLPNLHFVHPSRKEATESKKTVDVLRVSLPNHASWS